MRKGKAVPMDDFDLTEEEIKLYMSVTRARIRALEAKALKRLSMTAEEKALFKFYSIIKKDPELRDLIITLIMAGF